jgi:hypothetical protein
MENVGDLARLLAMLLSYQFLDCITKSVTIWSCSGFLTISLLSAGLLIIERVLYMTSGDFTSQMSSISQGGNIKFRAAGYSLSLATNVVATCLIAYRAW